MANAGRKLMTTTIKQMERQYGLRYETAKWGLFPVTHRLDGTKFPYSGTHAVWACVSVGNVEVVNWCLLDEHGSRVIHGSEQNFARTRSGYYRMIRRALQRVRSYGAVRVYPRRVEDRAVRFEISRRWAPKAWELRL
jgi:hypothetical protein